MQDAGLAYGLARPYSGTMMDTKITLEQGQIIVCNTQDLEPMLRWAKAARDADATGSKEYKRVGILPKVLIEKYCNEVLGGDPHGEFWQDEIHTIRLMNDPQMKDLRVWQGRI